MGTKRAAFPDTWGLDRGRAERDLPPSRLGSRPGPRSCGRRDAAPCRNRAPYLADVIRGPFKVGGCWEGPCRAS